jgi:hypothetical protein
VRVYTKSQQLLFKSVTHSNNLFIQAKFRQQRQTPEGSTQTARKEAQYGCSPFAVNRGNQFHFNSIWFPLFPEHTVCFYLQSTGGSTGEDDGEQSPSWDETKKNTVINEGSSIDVSTPFCNKSLQVC